MHPDVGAAAGGAAQPEAQRHGTAAAAGDALLGPAHGAGPQQQRHGRLRRSVLRLPGNLPDVGHVVPEELGAADSAGALAALSSAAPCLEVLGLRPLPTAAGGAAPGGMASSGAGCSAEAPPESTGAAEGGGAAVAAEGAAGEGEDAGAEAATWENRHDMQFRVVDSPRASMPPAHDSSDLAPISDQEADLKRGPLSSWKPFV